MSRVNKALELAHSRQEMYVAELIEFLAIPSVSTLPAHKPDMQSAAQWVDRQLKQIGMETRILPTDGHPVVLGEWLAAPGKPTVLVYGHYDVQPADPLNEWNSPPFEPTLRGDNLYARGASDMKGQAQAVIRALQAWLESGGLPVNVKVLIEGEEELGSPHLSKFIAEHKKDLACDLVLNADSGILKPDLPALVYGLRGLAYFEVWVYGPEHDLHSGLFGGSIQNPAQALCELIAGMHDQNGRVTLPGFYDQVRVLSEQERAELAREPHSDEEWVKMAGVSELHGEKGFTTLERLGARPTLEVNGLMSGFTGEGIKTVLPAKAMAKISMRLVPFQNPNEIHGQLQAYLAEKAPPTVRWEVRSLGTANPMLVERNSPGMRAAVEALRETFGVEPVFKLEGGTVPVVSMVHDILGVSSIQMGFALPDDNFHGPNEKLHLPTFQRGVQAFIRFFDKVSALAS